MRLSHVEPSSILADHCIYMNQSFQPPISLLPPELLVEVFVWCVAGEHLAPLTLRRVLKWWYLIVDSSPRIWQRVELDDNTHTISFLRSQAELWLLKSNPLPLDIEVKVKSPQLILPILSPLLPSVSRWRTFILHDIQEDSIQAESLILGQSLKHLCIDLKDGKGGLLTFDLEHLSYIMKLRLLEIPEPHLLAPLQFTTVQIIEDEVRCDPLGILNFLTACPMLESFCFRGWHHNDDFLTDNLPIVSLPNLETLEIKSTCMARSLLSSLYTPQLQNLCLAHLNVEYPLRGEYHEDGDSDDEAQDFSQSPSSDHAIGMGLRKLITRSHPPLKVLTMDFSDMRTKDFKYIFDRLPKLEDFSIVASDLSDNVIQLFCPCTNDGEPDKLRARMPSLRTIALYNCQRLSGNAVVNALASRVSYTDTAIGTNTLTKVTIVGCDGFTYDHRQALSGHLGGRLFLT